MYVRLASTVVLQNFFVVTGSIATSLVNLDGFTFLHINCLVMDLCFEGALMQVTYGICFGSKLIRSPDKRIQCHRNTVKCDSLYPPYLLSVLFIPCSR